MKRGYEGTLLVGFTLGNEDPKGNIAIVGVRKPKDELQILNAFQGADAEALYEMLTGKKEEV